MIMACGGSVYWFILEGVVGVEDNEKFLSYKDFLCVYLKLVNDKDNSEFINAIAKIADTTKSGLISFVEFQAFESILCAPDAISLLSFKLFDVYKSGKVSYGSYSAPLWYINNFNFQSSFVKQYFGSDHSHELSYEEFVQLLQVQELQQSTLLVWSRQECRIREAL